MHWNINLPQLLEQNLPGKNELCSLSYKMSASQSAPIMQVIGCYIYDKVLIFTLNTCYIREIEDNDPDIRGDAAKRSFELPLIRVLKPSESLSLFKKICKEYNKFTSSKDAEMEEIFTAHCACVPGNNSCPHRFPIIYGKISKYIIDYFERIARFVIANFIDKKILYDDLYESSMAILQNNYVAAYQLSLHYALIDVWSLRREINALRFQLQCQSEKISLAAKTT